MEIEIIQLVMVLFSLNKLLVFAKNDMYYQIDMSPIRNLTSSGIGISYIILGYSLVKINIFITTQLKDGYRSRTLRIRF